MDAVIFTTFPNARDFYCYRDVLSMYFPGAVPGEQPKLVAVKESGCVLL
jgi:hypothetical protein